MYLVAGLGLTGQSVLRYFSSQGKPCLAFDTSHNFDLSKLQAEFEQVKFASGEIPTAWFSQFNTLVLSPGISKAEPWVVALQKLGKQIVGDIEIFSQAVSAPVIAITGTNGKSTVTTMTGMALETAGYKVGVGGNIGTPALDLLLDDTEYDVFVLELSSFQLETMHSLMTISATVLNISEDHMDRYDKLEDYIQTKLKVLMKTDLAIIPENLNVVGLINPAKVCRFGLGENVIQSNLDFGLITIAKQSNNHAKCLPELWLSQGKTPLVAVSDMLLPGKYHQLNALAMMALCKPFKVSAEHFYLVLQRFSGLAHRTQRIGYYAGVEWINDSKSTNVGATVVALESIGEQIKGKLVLIAGGVSKNADFSDLAPVVTKYCRQTILFGRDRSIIAKRIEGQFIQQVETLSDAVELAKQVAKSEDCVLFSPACASFDQFTNYMQRGNMFTQLFESLSNSQPSKSQKI